MTLITRARDALFTRPPEEHLPDMRTLREQASAQKRRCRTVDARDTDIQFADDGQNVLFGDVSLRLDHYSLGQIASLSRVPMPLLARLDGPTRARVLNETFPRTRRYKVGLADEGRLRCLTSDRYERVWDADVLDEIDRWLMGSGFIPAMPTINTDDFGSNVMGNTKPALFRGDRDMFAFFYSDQQPAGDEFGGLRKGVLVFNSEVGASSFGYSVFYFRGMCANFLIWDATGIRSRRARHTGAVRGAVSDFRDELVRIGSELTTAELDVFDRAAKTRFVPPGPSEDDEAIKRLNREFRLSQADAREVVDLVRHPENPGELTVWGVVNGMTSAAKAHRFAADRVAASAVAGRLLNPLR